MDFMKKLIIHIPDEQFKMIKWSSTMSLWSLHGFSEMPCSLGDEVYVTRNRVFKDEMQRMQTWRKIYDALDCTFDNNMETIID